MLIKFFKYLFLFFTISLFTCKERKLTPPENLFEGYYPLTQGEYIIYAAKRVNFVNAVADSALFQIKEINMGKFTDQEGNTNYRIERFKRKTNEEEWLIDSVWAIIDKKDRIIKVENNIPYIKMVYPINKDTKWDGNIMNSNQYKCGGYDCKLTDNSSYSNIATSFTVNGKVFDNTLTVNNIGVVSTIDSILGKNIYSKEIGRVYTEKIHLKLCDRDSSYCKFRQIMDGYTYEEKYIEHGKE